MAKRGRPRKTPQTQDDSIMSLLGDFIEEASKVKAARESKATKKSAKKAPKKAAAAIPQASTAPKPTAAQTKATKPASRKPAPKPQKQAPTRESRFRGVAHKRWGKKLGRQGGRAVGLTQGVPTREAVFRALAGRQGTGLAAQMASGELEAALSRSPLTQQPGRLAKLIGRTPQRNLLSKGFMHLPGEPEVLSKTLAGKMAGKIPAGLKGFGAPITAAFLGQMLGDAFGGAAQDVPVNTAEDQAVTAQLNMMSGSMEQEAMARMSKRDPELYQVLLNLMAGVPPVGLDLTDSEYVVGSATQQAMPNEVPPDLMGLLAGSLLAETEARGGLQGLGSEQ